MQQYPSLELSAAYPAEAKQTQATASMKAEVRR